MITDVLPLFADNLVCSNLSLDVQALIKLLQRDIVKDPNREFYLTKSHELHTLDEYNFISKPILEQVKTIFDSIYEYKDVEPYFTQMWGTSCGYGQKIHSHTHPNSFMSGVFYPQASQAPIRFHTTPRTIVPAVKFSNICNSTSHVLNPMENTMLLFPSTLQHETATNFQDDPRYSVSFNIFLKGKIGNEPLSILHI
tara:strand:- start:1560 stop:2150 length:591 start_codon:yes stop_codon:yes gene_type:complete